MADESGLHRAAAGLFARLARQAVADRGRFFVALAGGSTPRGVYECLAESPFRERIPWDRFELFWGDERSVPPEHPDSNFRMAWDALLSRVPIPPGQIHRMPGEAADPQRAASEYELELSRVFGIPPQAEPPVFDLILLGMGTDGHTASLFPDSPALQEKKDWVVATRAPVEPAGRMTLTPGVLDRARCVAFLVAGDAKADTLARVLEGHETPHRLPAQSVERHGSGAGRRVWIVDRAAASKLRGVVTDRPRLAPSILTADLARLGEQVRKVEEAGADRLHLDVTEGRSAPNLSRRLAIVRSLRRVTLLPIETHLTVTDPEKVLEALADAGSDRVLFHLEATSEPAAIVRRARDLGLGVGVALKPSTPPEALEPLLPEIDLALVPTVGPGSGRQRFRVETLPRISWLREAIQSTNPTCDLGVEGGIDTRTAALAHRAGARVFVADSAIFASGTDPALAMAELRAALGIRT